MLLGDTERFTGLLWAKQAELSGSLRNWDEIVEEHAPDPIDQVRLMGEREFAIRTLDRDSSALRLIHRALSRIAHGTYGICQRCEENISPKRLAAVPWAAFCIACQEMSDRREIEIDKTTELLPPAA
jgi:DnaK suppressor protein